MSYLTEDFRLKTNLIAVNQYTPSREIRSDSGRAGRLIRAWVGQALKEYGLDWSMLLHTVTDSSPEMRAAFGESHGGCWRETCIPHMLNRVIVDAFGLSRLSGKCENPAARSVIMAVRKILRDVQSSSEMLASVSLRVCVLVCFFMSMHTIRVRIVCFVGGRWGQRYIFISIYLNICVCLCLI